MNTVRLKFERVGVFPLVLLFAVYSLPVECLMNVKPFFGLRFWGAVDGFSHCFIGSIILFPLFREYTFKTYLLAFFSGGILDIDHIFVVHSIDFKDIMMLVERPPTHSLAFAMIAAGLAALVVTKKYKVFFFCWVFIAIAQHVARDCLTDVTPILYPYKQIMALSVWAYVLLQLGLFLLARTVGEDSALPFISQKYPKEAES